MRVSGEEYLRVSRLQGGVLPIMELDPRNRESDRTQFHTEEIQRVHDAAVSMPEVRDEIVASLRERIESGTYHITGEQIAEMMVRRFLADRVR